MGGGQEGNKCGDTCFCVALPLALAGPPARRAKRAWAPAPAPALRPAWAPAGAPARTLAWAAAGGLPGRQPGSRAEGRGVSGAWRHNSCLGVVGLTCGICMARGGAEVSNGFVKPYAPNPVRMSRNLFVEGHLVPNRVRYWVRRAFVPQHRVLLELVNFCKKRTGTKPRCAAPRRSNGEHIKNGKSCGRGSGSGALGGGGGGP